MPWFALPYHAQTALHFDLILSTTQILHFPQHSPTGEYLDIFVNAFWRCWLVRKRDQVEQCLLPRPALCDLFRYRIREGGGWTGMGISEWYTKCHGSSNHAVCHVALYALWERLSADWIRRSPLLLRLHLCGGGVRIHEHFVHIIGHHLCQPSHSPNGQ